MATIYLAHIKAYDPVSLSEKTLYFASDGFVTGTANLPPAPHGVANTYYEGRIKQPALMRRDCWDRGTTGGESRITYGTLDLVNIDGGLDYLLDWSMGGRDLVLMVGEVLPGGVPQWTIVFDGTQMQPNISWDKLSIYLRDRQVDLNKPVCSSVYLGNNALPAGLEGGADLKGKRKPRIFGQPKKIKPICVNTTREIYQVNDGAIVTVDALYDRGVLLTKGADYSSQADMEANVPAAGYYRVWPAGGYFRLGRSPIGELAADVTQGASPALRTSAQVIKTIATTSGGLVSGDLSSTDITALDALNAAVIGLYFQDETSCREAIDMAANSIGAWWGFDRSNILRMRRFNGVSGSSAATLTETDILKIERISLSGNEVPAWKSTLKYARNWVVQNNDFDPAVTTETRGGLGQAWRSTSTSDASVKSTHLLADEKVFESYIIDSAQADAENLRRLNLYKVPRSGYQVDVKLTPELISAMDLGAVVTVQIGRFNLASGKDMAIIGMREDHRARRAELTLFL